MGVVGGNSGLFAWCASGTAAAATHILLLWSLAPAPRVETISAATTIQWEAVEIAPAPAAAERAELAAPPAGASSSSVAAAQERAGASEPVAASLTPAARTAAMSGKAAAPKGNAMAAASSDVSAAMPVGRAGVAASSGVSSAAAAANSEARSATAPASSEDSSAAVPGLDAAGGGAAASVGRAPAAVSGQSAGAKLLRGPRLLTTRDPCAGYFPRTAAADRGQVQLSVDVDARGDAHPSQTLSELPRGQGFEHAAKACAAHLHFAPALNAEGHPVAAQARIALKFDRS